MKKAVILVLAVLFASVFCLGLSAGGAQEDQASQADGKPVIGLVMKSLGAEFFKAMEEGAIAHADERGDLVLKALGTQSQTEIDQQISIVENLVTQKVDAIVVAPMDGRALVPPVVKAIEAGITVINIDVMFDDATMKEYGIEVPFIGPDNVEAAKTVGDVLAKDLGKGGKVIIIEGVQAAVNAQQRKEGFMQSIDEYGLELLTSNTANWEIEEAFQVFSNLLTAHPDVEGVMCANDAMALGVVQAIDAAGRTGEIKVIGFDNDPAIQPLIKEGKVLATIDQFGKDMASFGIDAAMDEIGGKTITGWIKTPTELITKDSF